MAKAQKPTIPHPTTSSQAPITTRTHRKLKDAYYYFLVLDTGRKEKKMEADI